MSSRQYFNYFFISLIKKRSVRKILNTRLFEHDGKRWQKSVSDEKLEILCISQFTLYHRLKGNKPDFHYAMQGDQAQTLYEKLLQQLGAAYDPTKIKDGKFGAMMEVNIVNSGPVTIEIESPSNVATNSTKGSKTVEEENDKLKKYMIDLCKWIFIITITK